MPEPRIATPESPPRAWDRFSISAEVRRRGLSLQQIALDAGLYESACSLGLIGRSGPGARAVAKALDIPFEELFAAIPPYDTMILRAAHRARRKDKGQEPCIHPDKKAAGAKGKNAGFPGQKNGSALT